MSDTAERREPCWAHPADYPARIPDFASEEEAADFWDTHDSAPYWDQMEDVTHNPPTDMAVGPGRAGSRAPRRTDFVPLLVPPDMLDGIKAVAAKRQVSYRTLMRSWIGERLDQELAALKAAAKRTG